MGFMAPGSSHMLTVIDDAAYYSAPLVADPLTAHEAADTAKVFKALSDPVRLRLMSLIASRGDGEVCVCDLAGEFDVTAPTISFHLKILREAGLVSSQRRGTWVWYRANQELLSQMSGFFAEPALAAR
jgi:ArsR family transcriptional regulator, arsenate/arsenite/antimonite-responsive transcriptional repressor